MEQHSNSNDSARATQQGSIIELEYTHHQESRVRSPNNKCERVDQQLPQFENQATIKDDSSRGGEHVGHQHSSTPITITNAAGHQHIKLEGASTTGQLHQQHQVVRRIRVGISGRCRRLNNNNKVTTASTLWHIHRDANFALSSAYYHTSMLPEYGQQQPTASPAGEAAAADATAGQQQHSSASEAQQQPAEKQQGPYIKWRLINVVINEELLNSMSSEETAAQHLETYGFQPSRYNRRYTDYNIELIYNGQQQREKVDITHFIQIKSVWGSTMPSPFLPDASTWLASHLIDYSIISSNVHVYLNSILEIAQHPTIKNKLAYFCHNIFGKSIKSLLMTPSGAWIEYKGINTNLQNNSHLASKFAIIPSIEGSSSSSDSEVEEAPSKKIKAATAAAPANDTVQQGTIMHFNK
eukprot:6490791-Amphidinium_carterae.1